MQPVFSYPMDEYVSQMQPYLNRPGYQQLLELTHKVWRANNYIYHSQAVPRGGAAGLTFAALQTRDFTVTVPPGSILTMLNAWHELSDGFKFNISDKGSKTFLVDNDLIIASIGAGEFAENTINPPVGSGLTVPIGGGLLHSPFIVCEPGQLDIEITSLATASQQLQLYLAFAVPIGHHIESAPVIRSVQ